MFKETGSRQELCWATLQTPDFNMIRLFLVACSELNVSRVTPCISYCSICGNPNYDILLSILFILGTPPLNHAHGVALVCPNVELTVVRRSKLLQVSLKLVECNFSTLAPSGQGSDSHNSFGAGGIDIAGCFTCLEQP